MRKSLLIRLALRTDQQNQGGADMTGYLTTMCLTPRAAARPRASRSTLYRIDGDTRSASQDARHQRRWPHRRADSASRDIRDRRLRAGFPRWRISRRIVAPPGEAPFPRRHSAAVRHVGGDALSRAAPCFPRSATPPIAAAEPEQYCRGCLC